MEFNLKKIRTSISDEELLTDLKRVAEKLSKAPTIAEYNSHGEYEATAIYRRFGSWNNALKLLSLSPNNSFWTDEELFDNLYNVWIAKGKQPSRRDMDNKQLSSISSGAYLRHFNSWMNALESFVNWINNYNDYDAQQEVVQLTANNQPYHQTKRDINLRMRFLVLQRDHFKCCICGRSPATCPGTELQVDHIKPWANGGETILENLQTLCKECNIGKSNTNE